MFSGKIYGKDNLTKVWKQFRLRHEYGLKTKNKKFVSKFKKELKLFEKQLKQKLSDKLDKKYWHKRRPLAHLRDFPYENTGKQKRSIKANLLNHITQKGNLVIKAWVEIGVPYAYYTNEGLPHRNSSPNPNWKGWVDDVLFGEGRGGLTSVSNIFDEMVKLRKELVFNKK